MGYEVINYGCFNKDSCDYPDIANEVCNGFMKKFFSSLFIWWKSESLGTYFFTLRKGVYVGSDHWGNKYFRSKNDEKRWVLYVSDCDASTVSPNWHGWLHKTVNKIPSTDDEIFGFHKNMTGTFEAYHPHKFESPLTNDYTPLSRK